jgi:hypothetical protein
MIVRERTRPARALRPERPALSWEYVDSPQGWGDEELRREWARLVERSDHPYALFQSPEWFDHMVAADASRRLVVAVARDERGQIAAVVPIRLDRHALQFHVLRDLFIGTAPLLMAYIMGGQPLMPAGRPMRACSRSSTAWPPRRSAWGSSASASDRPSISS